jgi:hypothetical protein
MTNAARSLAVAALMLCGSLAPALAQNTPAAAPQPAPVADPGTTVQANCISENDHYVRLGKGFGFRIELTNKCEQRLRCRVFAYVTSARGAVQGRGTIVLAPQSKGAAATSDFTMKAKMNGGSSQSDRECRVF